MTFYHTAKSENIKSILKFGLIPNYRASNVKAVEDDRKGIFLCNEESVPYWMMILQHDAVLTVEITTDMITDSFEYTMYSEVIVNRPILPTQVQQINADRFTRQFPQINVKIANSVIKTLSWVTTSIVNHYEREIIRHHKSSKNNNDTFKEYLDSRVSMIRNTGEKVDFDAITDNTKIRLLKDFGNDGEYTFCDTYFDGPKRMWEQIMKYDDPETLEHRQYIHDFIKENFTNVLYTNTGGYNYAR